MGGDGFSDLTKVDKDGIRATRHAIQEIASAPPKYGRSTAGIAIEPSACW